MHLYKIMDNKIIIKGAREHNLKNIDLELPRNKFIVFTGLSGSGKSTLAFDTIFAEGQRRYLESLSSYARQFLGQMDKPDVDYIEGLSPAISIDQKSTSHNPRSTVGTVTEIHDYLRLLYAKIGVPHCPVCNREISKLSTDEIVDRILELAAKPHPNPLLKKERESVESAAHANYIELLAPVVRERKGEYLSLLDDMWKRGFSEAIVNGKRMRLEDFKEIKLERYKKHNIDIIVDRVVVSEDNLTRIFEDVEKALRMAEGLVKVRCISNKSQNSNSKNLKANEASTCFAEQIFNQKLSCPFHDVEFPDLEPRLFSFNSPFGACEACEGLGVKKEIDPERMIPDKNKTIAEGGIMPWSYKANNYIGSVLKAVCEFYHIPDNKRIRDLSQKQLDILLYGHEDVDMIRVRFFARGGSGHYNVRWSGIADWLEERYRSTTSDAVREDMEKYMSQKPCSTCKGSRYKSEVLLVTVGAQNIFEISKISVKECVEFFQNLKLTHREELIAGRILKEILARLVFLNNVGLDYLTLGRAAYSL